MDCYCATFWTLLATLIVTTVLYFKWSFKYWQRKKVPSAENPSIPFGHVRESFSSKGLFQILDEFYRDFKARGEKHMGFYLFAKPIYTVIDLDLVRTILNKDFQHFVDRGVYYNEEDDPISAHLFSIEGNKWRTLRAKLTPTFTSGKMKMMFSTLVDVGRRMEEVVRKSTENKEDLDIKDILARYSTDVIGSCAFGIDCNSLKDPKAEFRTKGKKIFHPTFFENLKAFLSFTLPGLARKLRMSLTPKDVSEFFMDVIKSTLKYREEGNVTRNDFMQLLVDLKNGSSELGTLTVEEIAAQAFVFFVAGFETSSTTTTFCLYELSKMPELQEKIREEINQVMKKHEGKLTYDAVKEMKLLGRAVDETLRKYPPVPMLNRVCTKVYQVPETDVTLDLNTPVFIPTYGIHHDPDIYPDPEKFDPERFTEEAKAERHPYSYLPFGEGPRNCIGLRFGLMQTKVGLSVILKNFRITMNERTPSPLKMDPFSFTLNTKDPIWLNSEKV